MEFEWDADKAERNQRAHGVPFELSHHFEFESAWTVLDDRFDYPEPRWRSIGFIAGRLHVIVFTHRGHKVRVISLRKANNREIRTYERR